MVLFSAVILCFLLDSFEVWEMVQLSHKTWSPFFFSQHPYCSGYDEHACDTIFFS